MHLLAHKVHKLLSIQFHQLLLTPLTRPVAPHRQRHQSAQFATGETLNQQAGQGAGQLGAVVPVRGIARETRFPGAVRRLGGDLVRSHTTRYAERLIFVPGNTVSSQ